MKTLASIHHLNKKDSNVVNPWLPTREPTLSSNDTIPVCEPDLSGNERTYLLEAFNSSWISSAGSFVEKFETQFAKHASNTRYAYATTSGTAALHLALSALGITRNDEVILPTFTMIATVNAVTYCGATPVLVDANPISWNIEEKDIEQKITKRTKAIIVVHIYGSPVHMDPILKLAKKYHLWVVEDAAEAMGAEYKGHRVGGLGDIGAFSTYANKIITTGEGGIVTTNNPQIAKRLKLLRNHAFSSERHFWHTMVGYGYRMTNLQAAIGAAQLEQLPAFIKKKRYIASQYNTYLAGIPGITLPTVTPQTKNMFWMYGIVIDEKQFGISKNRLRTILAKDGIETRSFFIPIHFQPVYFDLFRGQRYPVAERLGRDGLYLPSSVKLRDEDITRIAKCIKQRARGARS